MGMGASGGQVGRGVLILLVADECVDVGMVGQVIYGGGGHVRNRVSI